MIPRALDPFLVFPHALRAAGLPAPPDQTETFLTATGLLGPRSLSDIRRAAHATYGPGPERQAEFDAVFDRVFLGHRFAAPVPGEPEEMPLSYDAGEFEEMPEAGEEDPSGGEARRAEGVGKEEEGVERA